MDSVLPPSKSVPEPAAATARLLVADDDRTSRESLAALLRAEGHSVETCENGREVLARVGQGGVDLVLLDVMMPKLSGTETCRLLKSMTALAFLPVILVTARNDPMSRAEGLRMGADDYVGKPFDADEISARVAGMLRIKRIVGGMADERERLLKRAVHDDLTGLSNRRYFEARLLEERKRAERHHEPFACLLIDVTGAVSARDAAAGPYFDRMFARSAAAVKRGVRECDVVARYSDGTLAVLMPHTHFPGTIAAAERILRDVTTSLGDPADTSHGISIGAALFPSREARTSDGLLQSAESALEEARAEGGGRICVFQQRRYLYTPASGAPRSERSPASRRRGEDAPLSERSPTSRRRGSDPPIEGPLSTRSPASRRIGSDPPIEGPLSTRGPASRRRGSDPPIDGPLSTRSPASRRIGSDPPLSTRDQGDRKG